MGDPDVYNALTTLRSQSSLFLQLQGSVTVGTTTTNIACDQFWSESVDSYGSPFVQSELLEYQNGSLIGRVVADGNTVWKYNLVAHEFQSGLYGRYTATPAPTNYLTNGLAIMRADANQYASFQERLLNQTYGGTAVTYQTWVPGSTVTETSDTINPALTDVTYSLGTRRQVIFKLAITETETTLVSIQYQDISKQGAQQRVESWTLTPFTVVPSTANYLPYTAGQVVGWRAVTGGN